QGVVVEPADGGAVGAADVVGEDLEPGSGVGLGGGGEHQVRVGLGGVGADGAVAHDDVTAERAPAVVVDDALEVLGAGAVRRDVVDGDDVVVARVVGGQVQAGQVGSGTVAAQHHVDGVADDPAVGDDRGGGHPGAGGLFDAGPTDVDGLGGFRHHPVVGHRGALGGDDPRRGVRDRRAARSDERLDHRCGRSDTDAD